MMKNALVRVLSIAALLVLAACEHLPAGPWNPAPSRPAIVFVHGNGDTAALWHTTMWRFESNGWDRSLLHAIDFPYPLARSVDAKSQPGRSSSTEQREQLAAFVASVKKVTGRDKVVLVGNSRGGNAIRNYLKNGGGAAHVSHAILGGATNHGVFDWPQTIGSEFNAKGALLSQLNAGPEETVPGVKFLTIRSDSNDKYAQPDGRFVGAPGRATGVGYDAPALKGAENVVIAGLDHREVAFHEKAFAEMHRFLTGRDAQRLLISREDAPLLEGRVTGTPNGVPTNLPLAGARVEIYEVSPQSGERLGAAVHAKTTAADGQWGPFRARPDAYYEFVVAASGHPVTHVYRSPFPRSSSVIHLRPANFAKGEPEAGAVVAMTRPRGYFGHGRDTFLLDGKVPPGINEGVPGASLAKLLLPAGAIRAVPVRFNGESFAVRSWPAKDGRIVIAEFHY